MRGTNDLGGLEVLPAAEAYARHVERAAEGHGEGLIAHAYTRYLGDLSGGQIIKRLLGKSLGLHADALAFYEFPEIADIAGFKSDFRTAIDSAAADVEDVDGLVEEAATSFRLNIDVSNAIQDALR